MKHLRYRPVQAMVVAVLAALLTACATFAPLYYQAIRQTLASTALAHSPTVETSIQLWSSPASFRPAPVRAPEELAADVDPNVRGSFGPPVLGYDGRAAVVPEGVTDPSGELVWRDGICERLVFVEGRCPKQPGEIAVSPADAEKFGVTLGSAVAVAGAPDRTGLGGRATDQTLKVVGVYEQSPSRGWFGRSLTGRSGVIDPGPPAHVQHDVWVTARETFTARSWHVDVRASYAGFAVDQDAVEIDDLDLLGAEAERLRHLSPGAGTAPNQVVTGLDGLAESVQRQVEQSQVTVPLLMAQLCLLSVIVLWIVLLAVTEQRRPEVALARLRGRGRRGARRLLYAEVLPVVVLAVVPGAAAAVLGSWLVIPRVLPGDPPVEIGRGFAAAAALSVLVLVLVTAIAVRRVAHEPVAELLRRVPPRSSGWSLGATDAVVVAGCGGIVVVFATGGLDGPIALAAPGLLAVVVGLVLGHLTAPTAARIGRRRLRRGLVLSGVSLLGAARSPFTRRTVAIVTLASALAVFSADTLMVGARNRASAAEQEVGASRVVETRGNDLAAVRAALDEVDPGGSRATPVVRVQPPGDGAASTLAVVPPQFRAIAFLGDVADDQGWRRLQPPDAEPLVLTGRSLSVDLADSTLESVRADGVHVPVTVGVDLVTADGETLHTTLAELPGKASGRRVDRPVSCAEGCTIGSVWFGTTPGASIIGQVTLRRLVTASGETVPLAPADQWTPYDDHSAARATPTSTAADALTVQVESAGPAVVTMNHAWLPAVIPVLVSSSASEEISGSDPSVAGLSGELRPALLVGEIARVPGASRALVADLDALERGSGVSPSDRLEVWFADEDPAFYERVRASLAHRGVEIAESHTLAQVRRGYDESAAAWSIQLAALVGVLAVVIALLVLVVTAASASRLRTRDLAALRMSGVGARTIRAVSVATELPATVIGVLAGCGAGLAGARLAMPLVPLFADAPVESTLDLGTAWNGVGAAVAFALLVLVVGSAVIGRVLAGRADLRRLREAL